VAGEHIFQVFVSQTRIEMLSPLGSLSHQTAAALPRFIALEHPRNEKQ
jgi:hypothetical protein